MLQPAMTMLEVELLKKYFASSQKIIEFGCGGSTCLAASYDNIETIHSIDSSLEWIESVGKTPVATQAILANRLHQHHVNIGPIGRWGMPIDPKSIQSWSSYYWNIWEKLPRDIDCILIDGRFRLACTLVLPFLDLNPKVNILIHDFSSRAPYQIIKEFFDEKEKAEDLSVFSLAQKVQRDKQVEVLNKYLFCPGDELPDLCPYCPRDCKKTA